MSKFVCELCGGTEFSKSDSSEFVCRGCGVIYSSEQMRAMMSAGEDFRTTETEPSLTNGVIYFDSDTQIAAYLSLAQEQVDAGDYELAIRTVESYQQYRKEINLDDYDTSWRLMNYFKEAAENAISFSRGEYDSVLIFSGALCRYFKAAQATSLDKERWFLQIGKPMASFINLNNKLIELVLERLKRYSSPYYVAVSGDTANRISLQVCGNELFSRTYFIPFVGLETIYVLLSRGYVLPEGALESIQAWAEILDPNLADAPYVKKMLSNIEASCLGNMHACPKLPSIDASQEALAAEARSLWERKEFALSNYLYSEIADKSQHDNTLRYEALLHKKLFELRDSILADNGFLNNDCLVKIATDGFAELMEKTKSCNKVERFDLLTTFQAHLNLIAGTIEDYLGGKALSLVSESPDSAREYLMYEMCFVELVQELDREFLEICLSMLDEGCVLSGEQFALLKRVLGALSTNENEEKRKNEELEKGLKERFGASLMKSSCFAEKVEIERERLQAGVDEKERLIAGATEELSSLGILKISRKQQLQKRISSLKEEAEELENELSGIVTTLCSEEWDRL